MIDLDNQDLAKVGVRLHTTKGPMVVGFRPDKAPGHVRNFIQLSQSGFYDGVAFHRVIKNFMIQGGCPNTKPGASGIPGTGGPGHKVHAEFNELPHERGVLSMARAQDPNSAGSQFFVVHGDHDRVGFLDRQYTVFGKLVEGLDVLDEIANVDCEFGDGRERSRPSERIEITSAEVFVADRDLLGEDEQAAEGEPEAIGVDAAQGSAEADDDAGAAAPSEEGEEVT
jgi:peptidyl-prolyl cis-trans isomerase B (cyclophilin B)